jgi:ribosomal-protein-alanine N-acetyltransferase
MDGLLSKARRATHRHGVNMKLIEISSSGTAAEPIESLPPIAVEVGAAYVSLYRAVGYVKPWLGYFAIDAGICIGTCGFKGPPDGNRVEIAYFTFPEYERRGYATRRARMLVDIACSAGPNVAIAAQTLPVESASTTILKRLGFKLVGTVAHPEDGDVWEWRLPRESVQLISKNET